MSREPCAETLDTMSDVIMESGQAGKLEAKIAMERAAKLIRVMIEALDACEDYFDNRADADCDQDGYIPNEEMKLLTLVREALKKAGA